jgi:hypothetical protein
MLRISLLLNATHGAAIPADRPKPRGSSALQKICSAHLFIRDHLRYPQLNVWAKQKGSGIASTPSCFIPVSPPEEV